MTENFGFVEKVTPVSFWVKIKTPIIMMMGKPMFMLTV